MSSRSDCEAGPTTVGSARTHRRQRHVAVSDGVACTVPAGQESGVGRTYGPLAGEGESPSPEGSSHVIPRSAATRDLPKERAPTGSQRSTGDLVTSPEPGPTLSHFLQSKGGSPLPPLFLRCQVPPFGGLRCNWGTFYE